MQAIGLQISERDRKMLSLIAKGLSSKQIAPEMGFPECSVQTFRTRLFKRIGAKNAPHAVHIAHLWELI